MSTSISGKKIEVCYLDEYKYGSFEEKEKALKLLKQFSPTYKDSIELRFDPSKAQYIVYCGDKVVGYGAIYFLWKTNDKMVGQIEDVIIDKDYRGRGIGKILVDYLIEKARDEGCYKIILNTETLNNVSFYERCGFYLKSFGMRKDL